MIIERLIKFRDRLECYSDLIPVFLFIGTTLMLGNVYLFREYNYLTQDDYMAFDWYLNHFTSGSLITLVYAYAKSRTYRWFGWACLLSVSAIWLINLIYVLLKFDVNVYYSIFVSCIYSVFVIFVVYYGLIRRR